MLVSSKLTGEVWWRCQVEDAVAIIYVQSQISLVFGEYSLCKNFPQYNEISQNSLRPSAAPFSTNLEKAKEDRLLDYGKRWVEKHLTRRQEMRIFWAEQHDVPVLMEWKAALQQANACLTDLN